MPTKGKPTRRPRAWWQWVIGLGLLAAAGILTIMRYVPGLRPGPFVAGRPATIRIPADLPRGAAIPARRGEYAGCNVLLITLDTTRADRFGCYGNTELRTPNVDRLAHEGVLFARAVAPAPATLPSHASILTGLYPYHHGARANSSFRLQEDKRTLAEILLEQGYETAAFVSAFVLDARFGLNQGFVFFDDDLGERDLRRPFVIPQRGGGETTDRALAWLRERTDRRFFLWVHYFDPHYPYEPPSPYAERYRYPYDGEVAYTDSLVGRLLDELDTLGLAERTLVILAGDHGEGLGQHDEPTHSVLIYDSTLRVPLILRCGQRLGGGVVVERPVSLVDIVPTVLTLLGVKAAVAMDGRDLTQPVPDRRAIFSEAMQAVVDYGWAGLLGVVEGPYKLIHGPKPELYDIAKDPLEKKNLYERHPEIAARLMQRLASFYGDDLDMASSPTPTEQLAAEEIAALQALGYAGSPAETLPPPAERPDPKKMLPLLERVFQAGEIGRREGVDEAIKALKKVVKDAPQFAHARKRLADAYAEKGELDKAEAEYRACLDLPMGRTQALISLARLKAQQNEVLEAIKFYRSALAERPQNFSALMELSTLLLARGDYREAVPWLKQAVRIRANDHRAPDMLASALSVLNQREEGIELFRKLLKETPTLVMVRNAMARLLSEKGQYAEALQVLRDGVIWAQKRREYELINNLAVLLVNCPDPSLRNAAEAFTLMDRVCEETDYQDPRYLYTLSMIYASQLRFDEAIAMAEKARDLAMRSGKPDIAQLAPSIGVWLERYRRAKEKGLSPFTIGSAQTDENTAAASVPASGPAATQPVGNQSP